MTRDVSRFLAPDFLSLTIGIVVYFVGVLTTQRVKFLRDFSIPEPVSGGFIAGAAISLVYLVFKLEIDFDLTTRDRLLVIFFAAVGINTRLADRVAGGRSMVVLCVISAVFVIIQNIVGTAGALSRRLYSVKSASISAGCRIGVGSVSGAAKVMTGRHLGLLKASARRWPRP
jgi:ESS family glutamate:Na+ symporter